MKNTRDFQENLSKLIATASLDDLEVIASDVTKRRDQLAKSQAYKAKRLSKAKKSTSHGQAIVDRLFG